MARAVEIKAGIGALTFFSFVTMITSCSVDRAVSKLNAPDEAVETRLKMAPTQVEQKDREIMDKIRSGAALTKEEFDWISAKDRVEGTLERVINAERPR